jgi:hypothetical protein
MQKVVASLTALIFLTTFFARSVLAQRDLETTVSAEAATSSAQTVVEQPRQDVTRPEEGDEKKEVLALLAQRPAERLKLTNFFAFAVQTAIKVGVPANTIVLLLLLPLLATIIVFFRHIVGVPSMGLLVPIALSITLLATGLTAGAILLTSILLGTTLAQVLLKRLRMMQLPKLSLSLLVVSVFVFAALTLCASFGLLSVRQISIFPILLFVILSERIVALQLERPVREIILIIFTTFILSLIGLFLLRSTLLRVTVLLYPEVVLLLIPVNIVIGRYFGLRISEYMRFAPILRHGSK